jgi:hypothetical protein
VEKAAEEAGDEVAVVVAVKAEDKITAVVAEAMEEEEEAEVMKPVIILQKNGINCPMNSA